MSSSGATGTGQPPLCFIWIKEMICCHNFLCFFFSITTNPPLTLQCCKSCSYLYPTTLTTSSLVWPTFTTEFLMVHLWIAMLPHQLLLLEHFTAWMVCEFDCFAEGRHCVGRKARKWVINALHLLSWELLDRNKLLWSDRCRNWGEFLNKLLEWLFHSYLKN